MTMLVVSITFFDPLSSDVSRILLRSDSSALRQRAPMAFQRDGGPVRAKQLEYTDIPPICEFYYLLVYKSQPQIPRQTHPSPRL